MVQCTKNRNTTLIRHAFVLTLLAGTALAQTPASVPAPVLAPVSAPVPERVRGTIVGLDGPTLTVRSRDDRLLQITLAEPIAVAAVVPAKLTDAKPGSFIGAAATGPKDKLRALEILIFPESMRGSGEGHYPWDLQPESTMTNATIESEVASADGRTLTVAAKGERLAMIVPPDAPVVTFEPGTPAMLTPGAQVFIGATRSPDGTLRAARVNVGKDGLTPPM